MMYPLHASEIKAFSGNGKADNVKLSLLSTEGWDEIVLGGRATLSTHDAYRQEGWYRRCVDIRAAALGAMPFIIRRGETDVWDSGSEASPPNELAFLTGRSPDLDGIFDLLMMTEAALVNDGQAIWLRVGERRVPEGFIFLDPTRITPIRTEVGIIGYERQLNNRKIRYTPEQVVAFFTASPYVELGGGDALGMAARVNADVLLSMNQWLDQYLDKGLVKAVVVATDGVPPEPEKMRFMEAWKRMTGKKHSGEPVMINRQVAGIHTISEGLGDLSDKDVTETQRLEIAAALGVPLSMLTSSAANFATKQSDQEDLYLFTVIPQARRIEAMLNQQVFVPIGLEMQFQPQRIEVLQRSEVEKANSVAQYGATLISLLDAGILTVDEVRSIILPLLDVIETQEGETPEGDGMAKLFASPVLKVGF